jgi:hypothetical protein
MPPAEINPASRQLLGKASRVSLKEFSIQLSADIGGQ